MENIEIEDQDQDNKSKKIAKHEEQGVADLERVTDFHEEIELGTGTNGVHNIFKNFKPAKKDAQLPKIKVKNEDIQMIVKEMEVSNKVAENKLKENNGDVFQTLVSMMNS